MVTQEQLLDTLRDFSKVAIRHRPFDRDGVESWRFTFNQVEHLLHFHTQAGTAAVEFSALMRFQELKLPAPRAIALLKGFSIDGRKGDAVILTRLHAATRLDEIDPATIPAELRLAVVAQLIELLKLCHTSQCCPRPLTLARFALHQNDLPTDQPLASQLLLVPDTVAPGGFVNNQRLGELNASSYRLTTRQERREFATLFGDGRAATFPATPVIDLGSPVEIAGSVGLIRTFPLQGCWWSSLAHRPPTADEFRQLPGLLDHHQGKIIKRDASGCVRQITFNQTQLIVKSPQAKGGPIKSVLNRFRPARVMRVWHKTHRLLERGFCVEIPLLVLESPERQTIVFERVPGVVLSEFDFSLLDAARRTLLFTRLGRCIRRIEEQGWSHFDTKTSNWVVATDRRGDPCPVMIDCDGVRFYRWRGFALRRLVRALEEHPHFSIGDRLALQAAARHNGASPRRKR